MHTKVLESLSILCSFFSCSSIIGVVCGTVGIVLWAGHPGEESRKGFLTVILNSSGSGTDSKLNKLCSVFKDKCSG